MYHGILVNMAFEDREFPDTFKKFAGMVAGDWIISGIEIEDNRVKQAIRDIQSMMRADQPFYSHVYNDKKLIIIFKDRLFAAKPQASTWISAIEYGIQRGIPQAQLDFWPNRFQDEIHYFK